MWVGAAVWSGVPVLDPLDPEQFEDGRFSLLGQAKLQGASCGIFISYLHLKGTAKWERAKTKALWRFYLF